MYKNKRWCGVCNFLVYDPHGHPELSKPPPRAKTVADLHGAGSSRAVNLGGRVVPLRRQPSLILLPFKNVSVAAHSTCTLAAQPQVLFKPMRFVVAPEIGMHFLMSDLKIGNVSQFANLGEVSCSAFPPLPVNEAPVNNLKGMPCVMIGQCVYMTITNKSDQVRDFNALMYGVTLYDYNEVPAVYDDEHDDIVKG